MIHLLEFSGRIYEFKRSWGQPNIMLYSVLENTEDTMLLHKYDLCFGYKNKFQTTYFLYDKLWPDFTHSEINSLPKDLLDYYEGSMRSEEFSDPDTQLIINIFNSTCLFCSREISRDIRFLV